MGSYFFDSQLAKGDSIDYVKDKVVSTRAYINYMNIRLQEMFHYENLPETIPKEMLDYYLFNNGVCFIADVKKDKYKGLYALTGSFGGEPDPYYRPKLYVVANPGLDLSETYKIGEDGILIRNDSLWMGLFPLMSRYGTMLAENMVTIRMADIMLRVIAMMSAPDDKGKVAAEEYLKQLEAGELGVIGENRFFEEGVKLQAPPSNNGSYLTQFIELNQYLVGSFYNEVGLNANYNMKRESIGEGESSLNEDSLIPLCEDMLRCRQEDFDKVNAKFGTDIKVTFASAWLNNQKEIALNFKKLENEASQLGNEESTNEGSDNEEEEENQKPPQQEESTDVESDTKEEKGDDDGTSKDD